LTLPIAPAQVENRSRWLCADGVLSRSLTLTPRSTPHPVAVIVPRPVVVPFRCHLCAPVSTTLMVQAPPELRDSIEPLPRCCPAALYEPGSCEAFGGSLIEDSAAESIRATEDVDAHRRGCDSQRVLRADRSSRETERLNRDSANRRISLRRDHSVSICEPCGRDDFRSSHDLEDILTVVDGAPMRGPSRAPRRGCCPWLTDFPLEDAMIREKPKQGTS
jgi:hypothetical protein